MYSRPWLSMISHAWLIISTNSMYGALQKNVFLDVFMSYSRLIKGILCISVSMHGKVWGDDVVWCLERVIDSCLLFIRLCHVVAPGLDMLPFCAELICSSAIARFHLWCFCWYRTNCSWNCIENKNVFRIVANADSPS